jgi:hypothetical protein
MFFSRSQHAVIRVYDAARKVIETREHTGDFKELVSSLSLRCGRPQLGIPRQITKR